MYIKPGYHVHDISYVYIKPLHHVHINTKALSYEQIKYTEGSYGNSSQRRASYQ